MRRSSVSDRTSFAAPLRTQNDGRASIHQSSTNKPSRLYSSVSRQSVSSRQSNLPLATPKQLFGAPSNRNSRGSIANGRPSYSRGDLKKDTRPVFDKSFQSKCIKKLVEFLVNRNYPYQINSKVLISPMNKDFSHIFQFMYQLIEPKFALPPKFEEEVPRLMKNIGYPYSLTKSAFCTVGNRHSWPSILASLNWLKDYIEYLEFAKQEVDTLQFPKDFESDCMSEYKMLYKFYETFYRQFGMGEWSIEAENDALTRIAQSIVCKDLPCDPSINVESEHRRYEEEMRLLINKPDELDELKNEELSLRSDSQDFEEYLSNLREHSCKKDAELEKLALEVENSETLLDAQRREIEEKEKIVKAINMSEQDIELVRRHKEELQHQIARHIKETNDYDKEFNDLQIEIANLTSEVEEDCSKFNELYQNTAIVMKSQAVAGGYGSESTNQIDDEISLPEDFQLKVSFSQRQYLEWMDHIRPAVQNAKSVLANRIELKRDAMIDAEELKYKLLDVNSEQEEEMSSLRKKLSGAEHEAIKLQEQFKAEQQKIETEESLMQSKITDLSNLVRTRDLRLMENEKNFTEAEHKWNKLKETNRQYEIDANQFLMKSVKAVHKNFGQLEGLRKNYVDTCGKFVQKLEENQPRLLTQGELEKLTNC